MRTVGDRTWNAKRIAGVLQRYVGIDTIYCEPFCGMCERTKLVIQQLRPRKVILSDANTEWLDTLRRCVEEGTDWMSRKKEYDDIDINSLRRATRVIKQARVEWAFMDYRDITIPTGAVVYLDPPETDMSFDMAAFWAYVLKLSQRCIVIATSFNCPKGFVIVEELYTRRGKVNKLVVMPEQQSTEVMMANNYIEALLKDADGTARYDLLPKAPLMAVANYAHSTLDPDTKRVEAMTYTAEELIERARVMLMSDDLNESKLAAVAYNVLMAIWNEGREKK